MININIDCEFFTLSTKQCITNFDCGDAELNDFFNNDAFNYKKQLLARTNFFQHNETGKIVCAFSISPNSLKTSDLPNSRRKKVQAYIPREKTLQSYPAFLIGRLGVASEFNRQGIGSQLLDYIRVYCFNFCSDFCRYLLIDAYNNASVLKFYLRNNFSFVFSTEEQEREAYKISADKPLLTRYMFFDMTQWKNK
jgi:ribosomal protein S18 acetylase RimI-like enzyme